MGNGVTMNGKTLRWRDTGEPVTSGELRRGETLCFNMDGECWRLRDAPEVVIRGEDIPVVTVDEALAHAGHVVLTNERALRMAELVRLTLKSVAVPDIDDMRPLPLRDKPTRDWENRKYQKPKRKKR